MAYGNFDMDKGYNAGAALTKFRAVKYSTAETVIPVSAITDLVAGFPQFSVSTAEQAKGKGASVRIDGITEAEAAGAIPIGSQVQVEANGTVSAVVAASGKRIVGRCVGHAAVNAGDRIALDLNTFGGVA